MKVSDKNILEIYHKTSTKRKLLSVASYQKSIRSTTSIQYQKTEFIMFCKPRSKKVVRGV